MKKIIKVWNGTTVDWAIKDNFVDKAHREYMKILDSKPGIKNYKFESWLYDTYKVKWDTGQLYEKEDLIFEDERLMTLFLLKFQKRKR